MLYAGYLGNDGRCNGAAYSDPYGDWESVVVHGTLKITLQEQSARVNLNTDLICAPVHLAPSQMQHE